MQEIRKEFFFFHFFYRAAIECESWQICDEDHPAVCVLQHIEEQKGGFLLQGVRIGDHFHFGV